METPFPSTWPLFRPATMAASCMLLGPDWLQTIAKINPLHHTVAGMRALFNATYGDGEIVVGLVVLVALTVVTFTLGVRSFARSAA